MTDPQDPNGSAVRGVSVVPLNQNVDNFFGRIATYRTNPPNMMTGNKICYLERWDVVHLGPLGVTFPNKPPYFTMTGECLETTTHAIRGWNARISFHLPISEFSAMFDELLAQYFISSGIPVHRLR